MKPERIIIIVLIVIAVFIGFLLRAYNKTSKDVAEAEADFQVSAEVLALDFKADETEANKKYLGKIIEVSGPIAEVTHDNEATVIILKGNHPFENVSCTLEPNSAIPKDMLEVGSQVVIKGQCTGFLMDVMMIHATLINQ